MAHNNGSANWRSSEAVSKIQKRLYLEEEDGIRGRGGCRGRGEVYKREGIQTGCSDEQEDAIGGRLYLRLPL